MVDNLSHWAFASIVDFGNVTPIIRVKASSLTMKLGIAVGIFIALLFLSPAAIAQAPSSVAGDGFLVGVTSGTPPLASYGYYVSSQPTLGILIKQSEFMALLAVWELTLMLRQVLPLGN